MRSRAIAAIGLPLWDDLVASEYDDGALVRLSDVGVENAGYFVVIPDQSISQGAQAFLDWLRVQSDRGEGFAYLKRPASRTLAHRCVFCAAAASECCVSTHKKELWRQSSQCRPLRKV